MATVARSPSSTPSHFGLPPPPPRRPSNQRRSSSSSCNNLLAPVARFSPEAPRELPAPIYHGTQSPTHFDSPSRPSFAGQQRCSFSESRGTAKPAPIRPPIQPSMASSSSSTGSLLQRRRSSAGAKGRERPAFAITELSLPALPTPPLSEIPVSLDELDDTIPTTIIGESSAAVTPGTPAEDAEVFRIPFKPTRSFVSTPFPEKRSFIDDEDEDEDEEEGGDEKEGRADASRDTL